MTEPEPTPGAPVPSAQPQPAPTPAPPPKPAGQDPNEPVDVGSLPANVQSLIKSLRDENAKTRTDAKSSAEAARQGVLSQVAKALGLEDEAPTAEQLAAQLERARDAHWASEVKLLVHRAAPTADVAEALLDSRRFIDSLDDLVELDPYSAEFADQIKAKVQEAAAKLTPSAPGASNGLRPDPSQGTRGTPAPARPSSLSEAVSQHYAVKR